MYHIMDYFKMKTDIFYQGDNLDIMQQLPHESIDLIATDPPFDTGMKWCRGDYEFNDEYDDFLAYMEPRIKEMHRLLKPSGSLYWHCDDKILFDIKPLFDKIFGRSNYRNCITWKRSVGANNGNNWSKISDYILYYTKSKKFTWNKTYTPYTKKYLDDTYKFTDNDGTYGSEKLTADHFPGEKAYKIPIDKGWGSIYTTIPLGTGRGQRFREHKLTLDRSEHASRAFEWHGITRVWRYKKEKLDELNEQGMIIWPKKKGGLPRIKHYLDMSKGVPIRNIITDIEVLGSGASERNNYPTQKPVALYKRIIKASSNVGDVVLDPFCGSGTTLEAAHNLNRRWIGIDKNDVKELVNQRANPLGEFFDTDYGA